MQMTPEKPRVIILGAGFGGLTAAKALAKTAHVTLVDRHNFQTFLPLLYQVSTAGLAADHVAHPVRGALRNTGVAFRMGSPLSINHASRTLHLDSGEALGFDHLVVALGSATADFGVPGVREFAFGMKSVHEAITIRAEVMRRFEDLCRTQDGAILSISVVGGGPTGVEMAGAFAELVQGPLKNDQAEAAARIDVYIIEAGPRLLPTFSESISVRTKKDLEKLGVKVRVDTSVAAIDATEIRLKNGESIPSQVTIWAAGVQGEPAAGMLNLPLTGSRIDVEQSLQVKTLPYIWAIGDIAGIKTGDGSFLPMVAPVAMQQGRFIAKQIERLVQHKALLPFKYLDKGSMATIGRNKAVVEVKNFRLVGVLAWYAWLFLHLFYLLGGRNKIGTIADWTWNYLTFDRGNRHVMDSV